MSTAISFACSGDGSLEDTQTNPQNGNAIGISELADSVTGYSLTAQIGLHAPIRLLSDDISKSGLMLIHMTGLTIITSLIDNGTAQPFKTRNHFWVGNDLRLPFWLLEPYEGKLSRTVLRGVGVGNHPRLPDLKSLGGGNS